MGTFYLSGWRRFGASAGALVCASLTIGGGCTPAEGGAALEARLDPQSSAAKGDPYSTLKETTFQALKAGSCLEDLVAFPANPRAIPVSTDPTTGQTSPLPFLEGESSYYLPSTSLGESAAKEANTFRICFDNVRQIAQVTSSAMAAPSELRWLRICGTEPRTAHSHAAGAAVILSDPQTCETVVTQRR